MKKQTLADNDTKCLDCGGTSVTRKIGPYRMKMGGDWAVTVEDAILTHCPDCGGNGVGFHALSGIMNAIAAAVARKPTRLAAAEIKFLRTHLDYTGRGLAKVLGVGAATVSRWENDKEPIGAVPDRLLRALVAINDHLDDFDGEVLAAIGDEPGAPMKIRVRMAGGKWKAAA